jgi:hypothetical protein
VRPSAPRSFEPPSKLRRECSSRQGGDDHFAIAGPLSSDQIDRYPHIGVADLSRHHCATAAHRRCARGRIIWYNSCQSSELILAAADRQWSRPARKSRSESGCSMMRCMPSPTSPRRRPTYSRCFATTGAPSCRCCGHALLRITQLGQRRQLFVSYRSLALVVCHWRLKTAAGPPQASGLIWSRT